MYYIGNPRYVPSMVAYMILTVSITGNSSEKLHCGNVVNMSYLQFVTDHDHLLTVLVVLSVYTIFTEMKACIIRHVFVSFLSFTMYVGGSTKQAMLTGSEMH